MRIQALLLAFALLAPCLASAQDYQWTDERGSVHFASDPSEVPARFREQAVRDAVKRSQNKPAAPAAAAPAPSSWAAPAPKPDDSARIQNRRIRSEAEKASSEAAQRQRELDEKDAQTEKRDAERAKREEDRLNGKAVTPEGFQRICSNVIYEDGSRGVRCSDVDVRPSKGGNSKPTNRPDPVERARDKALDDMGMTKEEAEKDPDAKKELEERTNRNLKRAMAEKRGLQVEDDDSEPSGDE